VGFPLFNKVIRVAIDEGGNIEFAQRCADFLNSMSNKLIQELCEASIRYCNYHLEWIGQTRREFTKSTDVLQTICPNVLIVPFLPASADPVIHVESNCDWEEEHGLEWIVRNKDVLYIGPWNGLDPMGGFSEKVFYNHA